MYCIDGVPFTGPTDYTEAIFKMVENTTSQETCKHPTEEWIEVFNVPENLRQYQQDDKDWLCSACGSLVPPF